MASSSRPLNLGWGSPKFLYPYWAQNKVALNSIATPEDYIHGGKEALKNIIKKLHSTYHHMDMADYEVVVTNGATQALVALLHSLKKPVWARAPHFSRFPTIASIAGVEWKKDREKGIQIVTHPNNPDGGYIRCSKFNTNLYDFSYSWYHYDPLGFNADMCSMDYGVFSFSKAFGFPSARIGWALVKDKTLAKTLEDYVEYSTAGVSNESQNLAINVITNQMQKQFKDTIFNYGDLELCNRWNRILTVLPPDLTDQNDATGMFLFVKDRRYFEDRGIIGIGGEHFGVPSNYYRINIGCSREDFDELIRRISQNYLQVNSEEL